jgi:hypothetical protein
MYIRLPLSLLMLGVLLSFQGLAYMGQTSFEATRSSTAHEATYHPQEEEEGGRSILVAPTHSTGAFYPDDVAARPATAGSMDLWMWGALAFGAIMTGVLTLLAAVMGLFTPAPDPAEA